jgi:2,4-dienoyl-CoA reductase-like NADH-dependent reductase (Old Yellow Enzyme family)
MPATGTNYNTMQGHVTQRLIDYYEERAKGGVGSPTIFEAISPSSSYTLHPSPFLCVYTLLRPLNRLAKSYLPCSALMNGQGRCVEFFRDCRKR